MTKVSQPYLDQRQAHTKNSPDWLVTVRRPNAVTTHRFGSQQMARQAYTNLKKEHRS